MYFMVSTNRIVWNGNDYWNDTTPDYDAVSINSRWMVVNDSVMINHNATYFWRTLLDRIGYATTPTSGYTETALGSSSKSFHGPFQRRMLLGTVSQTADARKTGKWVHLMRYLLSPIEYGDAHVLCESFISNNIKYGLQ